VGRVVVAGGSPTAARRVNATLRAEVERQRRAMRRGLRDWTPQEGFGASTLSIVMTVARLDARILSVEVASETYYSGAAHPDHLTVALDFDMRTGRRLPTSALFRPGALARVAALADAAMRADPGNSIDGPYPFGPVTADQVHTVLVGQDGLTIVFGSSELGPYVVGEPSVKLPFSALGGLIDPGLIPAGAVGLVGRLPGS
jgi:hypothetical protein